MMGVDVLEFDGEEGDSDGTTQGVSDAVAEYLSEALDGMSDPGVMSHLLSGGDAIHEIFFVDSLDSIKDL